MRRVLVFSALGLVTLVVLNAAAKPPVAQKSAPGISAEADPPPITRVQPATPPLAAAEPVLPAPTESGWSLARTDTITPTASGSFSRFTSTLGLTGDRFRFSTESLGNPVLSIDTKAGRKYQVSCPTRIDVPPAITTGACSEPFECHERAAAYANYYVSCEEPWSQTVTDCNVNFTGPMGGWDFIRKWGTNGSAFVDQLDRDGWVRQECRLKRLTCNPDRTFLMKQLCLMHRGNGVKPSGAYRRCDGVTLTPIAMHWTTEVGPGPNEPWKQIAQGLPLPYGPGYRVAIGGVFLAPADRATPVRIAYDLDALRVAGRGKRLVTETVDSDDPSMCRQTSSFKIFRENAFRTREEPVAWSVGSCTVTEYVRTSR